MIKKVFTLIKSNDRNKNYYSILLWSVVSAITDFISLLILFPTIYIILNPEQSETYISYFRKIGFSIDIENVNLILLSILVAYITFKNIIALYATHIISKKAFQAAIQLIKNQIHYYSYLNLIDKNKVPNDIIAKDIISIPIEFSLKIVIPFFQLISDCIIVILILASIFYVQFNIIILILLFLGPIIYLTIRKLNVRIQKEGHEIDKLRPVNFKTIYNIFIGFIDVIIANKVEYFKKENIEINKSLMKKYTRLNVIKNIPSRVMEIATMLSLFFLFLMSETLHFNLNETILIFAIAAFRLIPSLNKISNSLLLMKEGSYIENRIFKNDNIEFKKTMLIKIKSIHEITFQNVNFYYNENKLILKDINFKINKGDSRFLGESGSGKSTIVKLLLGFLEPTNGKIFFNDNNLNNINVREMYENIGYIHQDSFILNKSIAENIAIGTDPNKINVELVKKCIEVVNLNDTINSLEAGINTLLQDFGSNFSCGQKHRIEIEGRSTKNQKF